MLDQDQQQQRLDLIGSSVSLIMQSPNKDELKEKLLQYQRRGTAMDKRTAELYCEQGNNDITELLIIDEMMQCQISKKTLCKMKVLLQMWINSARATSSNVGNVERNDKTGDDSLKQSAVAKRNNKRSCKNAHSRKHRISNREATLAKNSEKEKTCRLCRECMQENSRTYETMKS